MNVLVNETSKITQEQLEKTLKYDFSLSESQQNTMKYIQSPEEEKDQKHTYALENMKICMNLDEFYDVVFHVENSYIKANSTVIKRRCEYFQAMLNKNNCFSEISSPCHQ